ncbi:MAG: sarcosine oxidase subunit gamma [Yangia sp.]|nr:sarcosine oxidase subunit gamma [Salipiger sp.]
MSDVITSQTEPTAPMAGALSEGLLRVEALPPQGQISLRGDFSDGFRDAVCGITGTGFPDPLGAAESGDRALLWMSRDELLFLLPYEAATEALARLNAALAGQHFAATDVSDARAQFRVTGPHLRDVLAKLSPTDMAPGAFAPGGVRRSRLAQVAAGYWLRGPEEAQVFVFRSVGDYAFRVLTTAAAPGGEVGFHEA